TLRYQAMCWLVLHENTPGDFSMREMVESAPDPNVALTRLWNSGHLGPREFVLNFLRDNTVMIKMAQLWPGMRPVTLEAAFYGDIEIQQAAVSVLEFRKDPDLIPVAMTLVNDVDPGVRQMG